MQCAMQNFRQGEIVMLKIKEIPTRYYGKPKLLPTNVIREGELSGHLHEVKNGKLYEVEGVMFIEADKGCHVIHPEHAPIHLPKGKYEIMIQREYDEAKHSQKVKD